MDNGASSYRRFLDGDESAFNEIMEELFRSLVFFINGYVHDIHAAEDIAIDAFSDLVVHRHRYNFKVTLKTYAEGHEGKRKSLPRIFYLGVHGCFLLNAQGGLFGQIFLTLF